MFRKRPDRIRGIAGSLDSVQALVVDGSAGAGPGIVRVIAESGAATTFAGPDHVVVDLLLPKLKDTPLPVAGIPLEQAGLSALEECLNRMPSAVVVNPSSMDFDGENGFGPQDSVRLARMAAERMRDAGRTGCIVFVTGIDQHGPTASAIAFLQSEMEQLAGDVATNGIRVNAVAPGHVAVNRRGKPVSSRVAPLGHSSIHPVEVGKAVWTLINEDLTGGITGATITVDRGASLTRVEF